MANLRMTKKQAARMFDEPLAVVFGVSRQAVSLWSDPLPKRVAHQALGLALRRYRSGRLTEYGRQVIEGLCRGPAAKAAER